MHQSVSANEENMEVKKEPSVADSLLKDEKEEPKQTEELVSITTDSNHTNPFTLILKLVFYTLIIIVLIYGLRKVVAIQQRKLQHNSLFNHLGGTSLGPNKSLQLVKVGGQIYLLGVGDQISLIKEIKDESEKSVIESSLEDDNQVISKGFVDLIQSKFNSRDQNGSAKSSFHEMFSHSLENQLQKRKKVELELQADEIQQKEGRFK